MKNYSARSSRFQYVTTYLVFTFFLFSTFFSGIPGMPTAPPEAHATPGEITYVTGYTYDDNSNVKSRTAPNGNVIKSNYDGLNRLIERCYLDNIATACTTVNADVIYTYDANGKRTSMTDSTGTTSYTYDRYNRLTSVAQPGLIPTYYEYDKANNLTKSTYPTGEEIVYGYDDDNRLTSVTDNTGITSYEYYNDTNLLRKKTLPDGVYTDYTYDLAHRIIDVENRRADDTLISRYEYLEYDANNNVKQVRETNESGTTSTIDYIYDKLNRLKSADYSDGPDEAYTYDESGNRLTKTTPAGTIDYEYDGDNRLLRAGNTIFFYDDSGNLEKKMTPDKTIEYAYDHENRLIEYTDGTDTIGFGYDGDGNRVTKTVNGKVTKYINDVSSPISQVLIETNDQNNVTNRYTYGFSRINQVSDSETYYLYNRSGKNATSVISGSGQILNDYEYDSFGNIKTANETVTNNFKYTGEQFDEETGLIYLRNRYYDPEVGRFITKDPFPGYADAPQTVNPYPYVGNNPLNFVDPLGLLNIADEKSSVYGFEWDIGNFEGGRKIDAYGNTFKSSEGGGRVFNVTMGKTVRDGVNATNSKDTLTSVDRKTSVGGQSVLSAGGEVVVIETSFPPSPSVGSKKYKLEFDGTTDDMHNELIWGVPGKQYKGIGEDGGCRGTMCGADENSIFNLKYDEPDWGGVSLSTTAEFMGDINDIAGAAYDEFTGQIILYGKIDASLPAMNLDDLAVAVRSVYGYGGQDPQDPGVSIDPYSSSHMKVRYDGQTFDTNFGYVMYEADRVLKSYTIGKDNYTNQDVSSTVSGYSSLADRYRTAVDNGSTHPLYGFSNRMWFVPQQISLKIQDNENPLPSMIFDTVEMEVLTESTFSGHASNTTWPEAFATHFTDNYDEFADESTILHELKTLGKITAVVKWIKDNDVPFDLSYFENYTPQLFETKCITERPTPENLCTPEYTPQVTNNVGPLFSTYWRQLFSDLPVSGGVVYQLDKNQNYFETEDPATDDVKQAAVNVRPDETVTCDPNYPDTDCHLKWGFSVNGEDYQAIAHSLARFRKDGNIKKAFLDMSFPVEGDNSLSLVRYYNSFNDKSTGFGFGWDMVPYKLRFPSDRRFRLFIEETIIVYVYPQIFINENGSEHLYRLSGLDVNLKPVYVRDGGKHYLKENTDETYTLYTKNKGTVAFDSGGKLTRLTDINDIYIDYNYTDSMLTSIVHEGGRKIDLHYDAGYTQIENAVGPVDGGKTITYTYNAHGDLETSKNEENETVTYFYDDDKKLFRIIDPVGSIVFDAELDDYNRATSQTIGSSTVYGTEFNLNDRTSVVTKEDVLPDVDLVTTQHFDELYRLIEWSDSEGRQGSITYNQYDFGPETVTDPNDNTSEYGYDSAGNVNYIKDAEGGERYFAYDQNNNLVIARDALENDTVYVYDTNNRLIEVRHDATAVYENQQFTGSYSYDQNNVTSLTYNYNETTGETNGNLESITDPEGRTKNLHYDDNGLIDKVTYPSGYWIGYEYNERSLLKRVYDIDDPEGFITTYIYDNADRVKTKTTVNVGTVEYEYDANGNIDKYYDAQNGVDGFTYDYNYDANNNLDDVTDAEDGFTDYIYDLVNNLLKSITLPNGTIKEIDYDALNRPITITYRIPNPASNPSVIVDTLDVGSAVIGGNSVQDLTVCNTGDADVNITAVTSYNSDFTVETTTGLLGPGECLDIEVTFNAEADTSGTGVLTIEFDNASPITVNLNAALILDPLTLSAVSGLKGIDLTWSEFTGPGAFKQYNVYWSETETTDISSMTLIATINTLATTQYSDTDAVIGLNNYYSVVAFNPGSHQITGINSVGPITFLNMGRIGARIEVTQTEPGETGQDEQVVAVAFNTHDNHEEYLMVYQYDALGNGTNYDIYGRIVSGDGQMGTAFPIMNSSNHEKNPAVAYNSEDNEYMVVAEYDSDDAGHYQIRAQKVLANGTTSGSPIDIHYAGFAQYSTDVQKSPTIAYNTDVNDYPYLVGFLSDYEADSKKDFVQFILNSSGNPIFYNSYGIDNRDFTNPKIAYNPDGPNGNEYYAVFEMNGGGFYRIYGLRIDAGANYIGDIFHIASDSKQVSNPNIAFDSTYNKFAVTFQYDVNNDGSEYHVYVAKMSNSGTRELLQNINVHFTGLSFMRPDIAYYDSQNEYLLTFTYLEDGTDYDVQSLRVPADTLDITDITDTTIGISTYDTTAEQASTVVYNDDLKEFLVAYEYDNGSDWDIKAQRVGNITENITLNPTSLDFGTDTAELTLTATEIVDYGTLIIKRSSDQTWIPLSGTTYTGAPSVDITVSVDRSGLPVGSYQGNAFLEVRGVVHTASVDMEVANVAPDTPSYLEPADEATDQGDVGAALKVTMHWDGSDPNTGDSLKYDVYFDQNPNPTTLVSDDQTANFYQSAELDYDTTYYWKVEAKDEAGLTAAGPAWSFTTIKISAPILNEYTPDPTNNTKPSLSWNSVQYADRYYIQIDDNSDFSSKIVNDSNVPTTGFTLASDLPAGNIYWRVASIDGNGIEGEFSTADSFVVDITSSDIPIPTAYTPDPTNNQTPTLHWSDVENAENYRLQISDDSGFANLLVNEYTSNTSFTTTSELPEGNIYWKLCSVDEAGNESDFSAYDIFEIDITAPDQTMGLVASHEGDDVTLIWTFSGAADFNHYNIYRSGSPMDNVFGASTISTSITDPATITYVDNGTATTEYFYAITAVDNVGNENMDVIDISNTSPMPDFIANPIGGYVPLTVDFYSTSTGYDLPLTFMWDIDDNGTTDSTDQDTSHTYTEIGLYSVKLTVTDYDNDASSLTQDNYISVCSSDYVRIVGATPTYFSTIQDAYNSATEGDTIQTQVVTSVETLNINRAVSVALEGGYDCTFSNVIGVTSVQGSMTVDSGSTVISNFIIGVN